MSNGVKVKIESWDMIRWTQLMVRIMALPGTDVSILDFDEVSHTVPIATMAALLAEIAAAEETITGKTWAAKQAIAVAETGDDILAVAR